MGLFSALILAGSNLFGQVQYKMMDGFGTALMDINSQGHGILMNGYYDFATNLPSMTEDFVYGTNAINDNESILGLMDDGFGNMVPGIRVGGTWTAFPASVPLTSDDSLYDISANGIWVVGQTAWNSVTDEAWGFIYNTQTQEFRVLSSDLYEYSAAYGVNNDGYAVGWVDDLEFGTLRMPAIFNPDGTITLIASDSGEASGINNLGQVVGGYQDQAFIYDITSGNVQYLDVPEDALYGRLADISDNGLAIGYAETFGFSRIPIIYHPLLGSQTFLLADILTNFGVDTSTLNGTAYRISADGNYVCGFTDGPAFFASGWAVFFDDKLLIESECTLVCPSNITVNADFGATGAVVDYDLTYSCEDEEPDGLHIVLITGLPSGSEFPIGSTNIYHELRDADENVISACSFKVIVNDTYCSTSVDVAEAISHVTFAGIDNISSPDSSVKNEFFLDQTADVNQGGTYEITVEGNTGGPYVDYVNVFIDWNQNGQFDEDEIYNVGALFNSTGTDGISVSTNITVPGDALTGLTRMRVAKNYIENPFDACGYISYGQTEDYSVSVQEGTFPETDDCTKSTGGNQFENALGPLQTYIFANDFSVPAGQTFTANQVTLSIYLAPGSELDTADLYLYDDSGAGPGSNVLYEGHSLSPVQVTNIGGNGGYIAYNVTFNIDPTALTATDSDTNYWLGAQVYASDGSSVYWEMTSNLNTQNEQYIFDPDDLIWVTNTSVFTYAADGVMSIGGICDTGSTSEDCDQGDDSNGFEDGFSISDIAGYGVADDFFVSAGNTLNVKQIEMNIFAYEPIDTMSFAFYEDEGGLPGSTPVYVLPNVDVQSASIGGNFGLIVYAVFADVDLTFEPGHYWMVPQTLMGAPAYWEINYEGTLGSVVATNDEGEPWELNEDGGQAVFKLHCEPVTPPDDICIFDIDTNIEPITRVVFANIDNPSSVNSSEALEDFTSIIAEVNVSETYEIAIEGTTDGDWIDFITVWIDWNQNGSYTDPGEMYEIGSIENSTGTDGQQAVGSITVPADAAIGMTTMRIIKSWGESPTNPCGIYGYGQGEDYSVNINQLGVKDMSNAEFSYWPNPVSDILNIQSKEQIKSFSVTGMTGQKLMSGNSVSNGKIDLTGLNAGVYVVQLNFANGQNKSFKVVKK